MGVPHSYLREGARGRNRGNLVPICVPVAPTCVAMVAANKCRSTQSWQKRMLADASAQQEWCGVLLCHLLITPASGLGCQPVTYMAVQ